MQYRYAIKNLQCPISPPRSIQSIPPTLELSNQPIQMCNKDMQYSYAIQPWGFREEQQAVRGSMTPGTNIYTQRRARTASSMQQCATVCSSLPKTSTHTAQLILAVGALCWDNWLQTRNLSENSSLEPAPKVWKPKARSKIQSVYFLPRKSARPRSGVLDSRHAYITSIINNR